MTSESDRTRLRIEEAAKTNAQCAVNVLCGPHYAGDCHTKAYHEVANLARVVSNTNAQIVSLLAAKMPDNRC